VSQLALETTDEQPLSWPDAAPAPFAYVVAREGPPELRGLIADIVLDGAGLYLAAATANLTLRVRLAAAFVPGLPVVPTGVVLVHGPIDASLWESLVAHARAAMPNEVLLAIVAREPLEGEVFIAAAGPYSLVEPQLDESGTGDWQPQQASGCSVRATPIPDAVVEVHSHHAMRAYFSHTDDRDETTRRVYGVLGRLDTPSPEVALRVATGCKPHAVEPVPFAHVFAGELGAFRDVNFGSTSTATDEWPSDPAIRPNARSSRRYHRASLLVSLVLDMAEDLAAIRHQFDARRPEADPPATPFWTPR